MTLYEVALKIAREERGLVAFAQHNCVTFEHTAYGGKRVATLGLDFMSNNDTVQAHAALLDQAAKRMFEHIVLCA
jgi:hypothetical protein